MVERKAQHCWALEMCGPPLSQKLVLCRKSRQTLSAVRPACCPLALLYSTRKLRGIFRALASSPYPHLTQPTNKKSPRTHAVDSAWVPWALLPCGESGYGSPSLGGATSGRIPPGRTGSSCSRHCGMRSPSRSLVLHLACAFQSAFFNGEAGEVIWSQSPEQRPYAWWGLYFVRDLFSHGHFLRSHRVDVIAVVRLPLAGLLQLWRTPDVPHHSSIDTDFQTAFPTSPVSATSLAFGKSSNVCDALFREETAILRPPWRDPHPLSCARN